MWNTSMCDSECNKACKFHEYLDIKNCLCKKRLFCIILFACQDEIIIQLKPHLMIKSNE